MDAISKREWEGGILPREDLGSGPKTHRPIRGAVSGDQVGRYCEGMSQRGT